MPRPDEVGEELPATPKQVVVTSRRQHHGQGGTGAISAAHPQRPRQPPECSSRAAVMRSSGTILPDHLGPCMRVCGGALTHLKCIP